MKHFSIFLLGAIIVTLGALMKIVYQSEYSIYILSLGILTEIIGLYTVIKHYNKSKA